MKKYFFILFLFFIITTFINPKDIYHIDSSSTTQLILKPEPYHGKISRTIVDILLTNHYKKITLNDSISQIAFNQYFKKLDQGHFYFLADDIEDFNKYRLQFCILLAMGKLDPVYEIFNRYLERIEERFNFIFQTIKSEFDFTKDEYYDIDREKAPWAKNEQELNEIWYKRLKYEALNLKLAGKKWPEISELLEKRYQNYQKRVHQTQSEDVFQVIMNSFTESFDPHTNYLAPKISDDFQIEMSRSLEGIGAHLTTDYYYTIVNQVVPGGPADKSKLLHANDKIIGVGQGSDGEIIDIIGWRLDDVVQIIRGPKTTIVRLSILRASDPPGSRPDTITIVRDKVKLEDSSAKSDTLEILHKGKNIKIGLIDIPAFYLDYDARRKGEPDYKSTTRDVQKLLKQLTDINVDGIIIDLRGNGGGFLNEAIDLTGLFIKDGPVVQVKDSRGFVSIEKDSDPYIVYDGPLAVIVDYYSASASEIFAAAIQDYNRGIIIGGQTYGKGTVQKVIDLNMVFRNMKDNLGQIKFTNAKFYRINGFSTQHLGVNPDIALPLLYDAKEIGESSYPNALLWDKVSPVRFNNYNMVAGELNYLAMEQKNRSAHDSLFVHYLKDTEKFKKNRLITNISLNEEKRKKEYQEIQGNTDENNDKKQEDIILIQCEHILCDLILASQKSTRKK
jgi:carboxyl-terminal processing protease